PSRAISGILHSASQDIRQVQKHRWQGLTHLVFRKELHELYSRDGNRKTQTHLRFVLVTNEGCQSGNEIFGQFVDDFCVRWQGTGKRVTGFGRIIHIACSWNCSRVLSSEGKSI